MTSERLYSTLLYPPQTFVPPQKNKFLATPLYVVCLFSGWLKKIVKSFNLVTLTAGITDEDREKGGGDTTRGWGTQREITTDRSESEIRWPGSEIRWSGRVRRGRWRTSTKPNSRGWKVDAATIRRLSEGAVRKTDWRHWRFLRR